MSGYWRKFRYYEVWMYWNTWVFGVAWTEYEFILYLGPLHISLRRRR